MKEKSVPVKSLRFDFTLCGGLALIGLGSWYRGHTTVPVVLWTISIALVLFRLISPRAFRSVRTVWMRLATILAWVNTRIILSLLFYAVLTPIGVIMRIFRDPLDRRLSDGRSSYWVPKEPTSDPKAYDNQF